MKLRLSMMIQPICFAFLLGLSSWMIIKSYLITNRNDHNATLQSEVQRNRTFAEIENTAKMLVQLNTSALYLARTLSSSLNGTELSSFPTIQEKVAPPLFLALRTIPCVSQVSYTGFDGLFFSFYNDEDETVSLFSNASSSSKWYTQPVNQDTGKLYGQAVTSESLLVANASWFQGALNRSSAYTSVVTGWNKDQTVMFLSTFPMDGRGVISIGFPAQMIAKHFSRLDFHGGAFCLATNDGQVLVESKLPNTQIVVSDGKIVLQQNKTDDDVGKNVDNYSCNLEDGGPGHFHHRINGTKLTFYCSALEIAGIESVYILAFPTNGATSLVHENSKIVLLLLIFTLIIEVFSLCLFIVLICRAARREMLMCAALVKQMESTQQAERKSMNKSLAFASASHDVRASLAAITGLIELSHEDAKPNSELAAKLLQMNTCANDLLGILNSVLATSKIEAGKMQLEVEEFNLAELLEDVVDMFYPLGMKKGVDVILDLCDESALKFYLVRGDRGKLKQILSNLLNNAIKFTSHGHVSVRAVAQKPSKENAIIASNSKSLLSCISTLCYKIHGGLDSLDDLHTVQQNVNCMEFIFEVDDTGAGIPKDKQNSVFENFVQVKETALGQGGCGLGLGIVQSLVRLMGGEIKIIDKEPRERGTCFRFNIFLTASNPITTDTAWVQGNYILDDCPLSDIHHQFGLHIRPLVLRSEGSYVVVLLSGEERQKIVRKVIESRGIKVSVVKRSKDLVHVLDRIKLKLDPMQSSPSKTDSSLNDFLNRSASAESKSGANEGASVTKDVHDHAVLHCKRSNSKGSSNFILLVIDAAAGPLTELCSVVANFKKDIHDSNCKVVWLDDPVTRNSNPREVEEDRTTPPSDHKLSKPLHGSRLYQVLRFLPEFGGTGQCNSPNINDQVTQECQHSVVDMPPNVSDNRGILRSSSLEGKLQLQDIVHDRERPEKEMPLSGKRVLVVEDRPVDQMVTATWLHKLGAEVDPCKDGREASDLVCKILTDQSKGHKEALPFDLILMDCQMPVMDGYEATRKIRENEKLHGIHIPIVALTAGRMTEETIKIMEEAGMDSHLTKPLNRSKLLDVIRSIKL